MQREIANVAAHCALQGFRYMAFPPLSFEPAPRAQPAEQTVEALPSIAVREPVAVPIPQAAAARPRRGIALLDDVAPRPTSAAPRPMRDNKTMRPALSAAPTRAERAPPAARAEREVPSARAEREAPSARAERATPSARAERATRYALLRDLSDDQR